MKSPIGHLLNSKQTTLTAAERLVAEQLLEPSTGAGGARRPWTRVVAQIMIVMQILQTALIAAPASAQVVAAGNAPAGQKPLVDAAANGVPIVLIAPPSAAGVSHNRYDQFNVGKQGLILNNSRETTATQLGGIVNGNMQLGTTSARIILNEVTSGNTSRLNGYIEVAGQRADLVIANPNGISCDGCGFLNTAGRATLSTGTPTYNSAGQLEGLNVQRGVITIGAGGLNASNMEQLDLLARGIVIEGEISTKNLQAVLGANKVLYGTLKAVQQEGSGSAPRFAVDIAELGGMYANQIYLVATEKGLGVNSAGRIAALEGNLTLSAQGDLTLKDNYGKQDVVLAGSGKVTVTGQTSAGQNVRIAAPDSIAIAKGGELRAEQGVQLATRQIDNSGSVIQKSASEALTLAAERINSSGSIYSATDLNLQAKVIDGSGGVLQAERVLSVTADSIAVDKQQWAANQAVALKAGELRATNGVLAAGTTLSLESGGVLDVQGSKLSATETAVLRGQGVRSGAATVTAAAVLVDAGRGKLDNTGGIVYASGALDVRATGIDNTRGKIVAADTLALNAGGGALDNTGGTVAANNAVFARVGSIRNRDGTVSTTSDLVLDGAVDNHKGKLITTGALSFAGSAFDNAGGAIQAGKAISLDASGSIDNAGGVIQSTGASVAVKAERLDNTKGAIGAAGDIVIGAQRLLGAGGEASAGGKLALSGTSLDLSGAKLASSGTLDLAARDIVANGATVQAGQALKIDADNLSGAGATFTSVKTVALAIAANASLDKAAIAANGNVTLDSANLNAQQLRVESGAALALRTGTADLRDAALSGARSVTLNTGNLLLQGGSAVSGGGLTINGLSQQGGKLSAAGDVGITMEKQLDLAGGAILSGGAVAVRAEGIVTDKAQVGARFIELDAGQQSLSNVQGTIVAESGGATGRPALLLRASGIDNSGGALSSDANAVFDASKQVFNNTGGNIVVAGNMDMHAGVLKNRFGSVATGSSIVMHDNDVDNADGQLRSGKDVIIDASGKRFDNQRGLVEAQGAMILSASELNNSSGKLAANQTLTLAAGTFNNNGGTVAAGKDLSLDVSGVMTSTNGTLRAGGPLSIRTARLDAAGAQISSQSQIVIAAEQAIWLDNADLKAGGDIGLASHLVEANRASITSNGAVAIDGRASVNLAGADINADSALTVKAGNGASLAGTQMATNGTLQVAAASIDAGASRLSSAGDLSLQAATGAVRLADSVVASGARLRIDGSGIDATNARLAAKGDIVLDTRGKDYLASGSVHRSETGAIAVKADNILAGGKALNQGFIANGNITLDASGRIDTSNTSVSSGNNVVLSAGQGIRTAGGALSAGGSATLSGTVIDNAKGAIAANGALTMVAREGGVDNAGGSILSGDKLTLQTRTGLDRIAGKPVAAGGATDLNNKGGAIVGVGGVLINSGSIDSSDGKIASGKDLVLDLGNSDLRAAKGSLLSENALTLAARQIDIGGAQVRAGKGVNIAAGQIAAQGASIGAAGGDLLLDSKGSAIDASQSVMVASGLLSLKTGAANLAQAKLSSGAATTIHSGALDARQASIQAGGDIAIGSAALNAQDGSIGAGGKLNVDATAIKGGQYSAFKDLSVVATGGIDLGKSALPGAQGGAFLTDAALSVKSQGLVLDDGRAIGKNVTLDVGNGALSNRGGAILATDSAANAPALVLTSNGLDTTGGSIVSNGDLRIDSGSGMLDNSKGSIGALRTLDIKAGNTANAGGSVVANSGLTMQVQALDNQAGKIQAGTSLTLTAGDIDNRAGTLAGSGGVELTAGKVDSSAKALIGSNGNVTLHTKGLNNDGSAVSAGGKLAIDTGNLGAISNVKGELASDGGMLLASAGALDNSGGAIAAGDGLDAQIHGALLNNKGNIVAGKQLGLKVDGLVTNQGGAMQAGSDLLLSSAKGIDNDGGKLIANGALGLDGAALSTKKGLISAGKDLTVDVKTLGGALDNAGGQIQASGKASVAAKGVGNVGGVLIANGELVLDAGKALLDNRGGIVQSAKASVAIDAGDIASQGADSAIVAATGLTMTGSAIDTSKGLISAGNDLSLIAQGALNNAQGRITAGANATVQGKGIDNTAALLSAGKAMTVQAGSGVLVNSGGNILAGDTLKLGAASAQNLGGTLASNGDLSLVTDTNGKLDNTGGTVRSAQGNVSLTGGQLRNGAAGASTAATGGIVAAGKDVTIVANGAVDNHDGSILAANKLSIQASGAFDNNNGELTGANALGVVAKGISSVGGSMLGNGELTADAGTGAFDNRKGVISAGGVTKLKSAGKFDNTDGKITTGANLVASTGAFDNVNGLVSAQGSASLTTAAFDGRKGEVIGQQALSINTQGARFDGSGARFASNGDLTLATGEAILTGSTIAAGDSFAIQSSGANTRLNADGIKIAVTKNITMTGADVALNGSNLQAGNTITVGGVNVGLNQAVLAANTAVNINGSDVQAVAVDIKTQGDISLQSLNTLDYRFGQFAAGNNANIYGGGLVATSGAKLAAGKRLSFGMGQALDFSKLDFTYQFGTDLAVQAIGIRTGGVAISGDNLFFNAGTGVLDNTGGTLTATGVVEFKSLGMINSGGMIAADHLVSLDAGIDALINDGGTIASAAGKVGIAGGNLLNKNGGNISAAEAVNVSVVGLADNSGGNIVSDGEVSLYAGTLVSNKGNIVSNKDKVTVNVRTFDNDDGALSARTALDVTATLDVSNKGGSLIAGTDATIVAKNGVNNNGGLIGAAEKVVLSSSTGILSNQGGIIQSDKATVEIDAAKGIWNQKGDIYGSTGVKATTDADLLNMQGGRIASDGEIALNSLKGKLDNTDGVVSSNTKLIVAGKDLINTGGVLSGLESTKVTADSVNNNAGVIEAGKGGIVITAKTLSNDNSGSARGIVSQGDIAISGGSFKQNAGYIGADGKLSIDGTSIDNTGGSTMLAMKELSLTGSVGINNQDGNIKSALDTTLKAPVLNNIGGTVFANDKLVVDAAAIDNSNTNSGAFDKGLLASNSVTVNAATVGNVNGAIVALKNLKVTGTASIDNSGGQLSGEAVTIDTADFINTGGRADATTVLTAHMAKFSANGVMASTGTLKLALDGDYTNIGTVAAENNLEIVLNNGKYTNNGTISAAKDLSLSANELNNYGTISAGNTTINVGSLNNAGSGVVNSIGNTTINAGNTVNNGKIYGGNVVMTGATVSNEAQATIGARDTLTVGGKLVNKPNADVISLGNMQLGSVVNAGGRIESGGNLNISGMLENLNCVSGSGGNGQGASNCAAYGLEGGIGFENQTTVEGMNRVTITPAGTNTEYGVEELSYYADDQHYYIHPSDLHNKIEDYTKKTTDTRTTVASVMTKSQAGVVTAAGSISAGSAINIDSQIVAGGNIGIGGGAEVGNGAIKTPGDSVNISTQGTKQVTDSGIKYDTVVGWTGTIKKKHIRNYGPEQVFQDVGPTTSIDIAGVLYDSGGAASAPAAPANATIAAADPAKVVSTLGAGVGNNLTASNGNTAAGDTTTTKTSNVVTYQNGSTTVGINVGAINTNTSVQGVSAQGVTTGAAPAVDTTVAAGGTKVGPQVAGTSDGAVPVSTDAQNAGSGGASGVTVGTSAQPVVTGQVAGNALPGSVIAGNARAAQQSAIGDLTTSFARFAAARPVTVAAKTVDGVAGANPKDINGRATDPNVPNVTLTSNADWKAPSGNLFSLKPGEGAGYLVETDPLFTDKNKWTGSDYFLTQLGLDPSRTLKRYGDGFVEQRAFADQLMNITGRNKLAGYDNNEKAFTALMDSGVAYAKQFQLTPGVALSEQQMAQLTTDIVWLQEETVTLPDGSTTKALVPQVYLRRPQQGDLSTGGALIAGDNVTIRNQNGSISNSGTILAGYANAKATDQYGSVTLDAKDVTNRGTIAGNVIDIKATNDIANVGGRIAGLSNKGVDGSATDDSRVRLSAGRDILVASTTQTRSIDTVGKNGTSTSSRTNIDRVATIAGGNVLIDAKGNFTARAAQVDAAVDLRVVAGKNIDITGVTEQHALFVPLGGNTKGRTGYTNESSVANIGSSLTAGNNIAIKAGGDATLSGSSVGAVKDVSISGANVAISAVKDRTFVDVQTVGRKQYDRVMTDDETLSGGVVRAGQNVTIGATGVATGEKDKDGKPLVQVGTGNLVLNAGNVTALKGTATLLANNDVTIQTVTTLHDSLKDSYSKSGNMVKSKTTTSSSTASTQQAEGSNIAGNSIAIVAGNGKDLVGNVNVIGSSVLADKDLSVKAGADINVLAATSTGSYSDATTVKTSGLSGAKNGLGFSAGSSTVKTREDGTHASQSETGSVLGSTGGNVSLIAGRNATIVGSDLVAGRLAEDTSKLNGNIDITAQNIAIIAGTDKVHQTSAVDTASKSVGVALVGTPLDTMRNLKDIKKKDSKFGRVNGALSELADSSLTAPQVAITFSKSKTSSSTTHDAETQSGSGLTASGNIRLTATGNGVAGADGKPLDGDILVSGSTITGGGVVKLSAERNVTVEASTDHIRDSSVATATSSSFSTAMPSLGDITRSINGGPNNGGVTLSPYNQKRGSDSSDATSTVQKASLINGNSVELVSNKGDILVKGSGVTAKGDIALTAKEGKIDIVSGQDGTVLKEAHSTMQLGDLGGNGSANTVGTKRSNDTLDTRKDQQNTIRSGIAAGGNLAITAKDDVAVRGSDLHADGNVDIKGKNVILDPGVDQVSTKAANQSSQFGVTVALSGYAVEAANALKQAAAAHDQQDNDKLAGIYALKAALTVANGTGVAGSTPAANNTQTPASTQASIKATVSIGGSSSDSTTNNSALQNKGSTVSAGQNLSITATGDGSKDADGKALNGDITAHGAVLSGKDVTLDAARNITLASAQDTSANDSKNASHNASIGVGLGIGGTQNGFTLELAAGQSHGNANGNATTNQNTSVTAGNVLTVKSGKDTTLAGAQVKGDKVVANIGGDLNIVSVQDIDNYKSREKSSGANVSICVPPFCFGSSSGSVNMAKSTIDSTFAGVNQQSGIYAGKQGFDVTVKNNTDLVGGVIASAAGADKNKLTTGTLTQTDVKNAASYDSDSSSVNLSYSSGAGAADTLKNNIKSNVAGNLTPAQRGNAASTTRSAIGEGTVVITDDKGQLAATGTNATDTVAGLNRDTTNSAGTIGKIFDLKQLQSEKEVTKALTDLAQQATPLIAKQVGDIGAQQVVDAQKLAGEYQQLAEKATANNDPVAAAAFTAKANDALTTAANWGDNGIYRVGLHTATQGIVGGIAGGAGGALSSGAGVIGGNLGQRVGEASGEAAADKLGLALGSKERASFVNAYQEAGAAIGGTLAGAAVAVANGSDGNSALTSALHGSFIANTVDTNNRQLHPDEQKLAQRLAAKSGGRFTEKQIADALRASGNTTLGESIVSGIVVRTTDGSPASAIYDTVGMTQSHVGPVTYFSQTVPTSVDRELAQFILISTGDSKSPYAWSKEIMGQGSAPKYPSVNPFTPNKYGCVTGPCAAGILPDQSHTAFERNFMATVQFTGGGVQSVSGGAMVGFGTASCLETFGAGCLVALFGAYQMGTGWDNVNASTKTIRDQQTYGTTGAEVIHEVTGLSIANAELVYAGSQIGTAVGGVRLAGPSWISAGAKPSTIVVGAGADGAGSGGIIRYIEPTPTDSMFSQEWSMSCGAACGRQILAENGVIVDEATLRTLAGVNAETGVNADNIAKAMSKLDSKWNYSGGGVTPETFNALNGTGPWIARLKVGGTPHFVLVDGVKGGNVLIRDPWGPVAPGVGPGLSGELPKDVFMEYWRLGINQIVYKSGVK